MFLLVILLTCSVITSCDIIRVSDVTLLDAILNNGTQTSNQQDGSVHILLDSSLEIRNAITILRPAALWVLIQCSANVILKCDNEELCFDIDATMTKNVTISGCIMIGGGIYARDLNPETSTSSITIANGIIDGANSSNLLSVQGVHNVLTKNLTMRYGKGSDDTCVTLANVRGSVTMEDTSIHWCVKGCVAFKGNASFDLDNDFMNRSTIVTLNRVRIFGCSSGQNGGALNLISARSVTISTLDIQNANSTKMGGGIYIYDVTGLVDIQGLTMRSCNSGRGDNDGGCISIANVVSCALSHSVLIKCKSGRHGGAIRIVRVAPFNVTMRNVTIEDSSSASGTGGGMYIRDSPITLTNVTLRRCTSTKCGAIQAECPKVSMTDVSVEECGSGSGALCVFAKRDVVLDTVTVVNSLNYTVPAVIVQSEEGTVHITNGNIIKPQGECLDVLQTQRLTVVGSSFVECNGSGLTFRAPSGPSTALLLSDVSIRLAQTNSTNDRNCLNIHDVNG
eukprot:PhF_6_TR40349/c0_g1_i1/m.60011